MSRVSTVPAVKSALVALIRSVLDADTTTVWRNRPNTDYPAGENVFVGDAKGTREWGQVGKPHSPQVQEDYRVEVEVEVLFGGSDAEGAEQRLFELIGLIDEALLDPTLGGVNLIQWGLVEEFDQTSEGGSDGWECHALLEVAVKARI